VSEHEVTGKKKDRASQKDSSTPQKEGSEGKPSNVPEGPCVREETVTGFAAC